MAECAAVATGLAADMARAAAGRYYHMARPRTAYCTGTHINIRRVMYGDLTTCYYYHVAVHSTVLCSLPHADGERDGPARRHRRRRHPGAVFHRI